MKRKEFQELKTRQPEELQKMLGDFRDKLWKLQEDLVRGKVKNIKEVKEIKRDIARVLTLLNK
jgi:ribosomal protein L29